MLSAATSRLKGTSDRPSSASSSLSAAERTERRLSRISPSEFDTILNTRDTVHKSTATTDEARLGVVVDAPPSNPSSPTNSPSLARTLMHSTPGLSPAPTTPDTLKRRSIFRSTGNASSPDLSSLLKKAREGSGRIGAAPGEGEGEEEVLTDGAAADKTGQYDDAETPPSSHKTGQYDDAETPPSSPSKRPSSGRGRARTSPSMARVSPPSPSVARMPSAPSSSSLSQLSVPDSRTSTVSSAASGSKPRLSSMSTFSTGSYVHVPSATPFPSGTTQAQVDDMFMSGMNPSVTSLALKQQERGIGFDFVPSPGRKKSSAGVDEGKLSLSNTMRKTSRFFRKLGSGSGASSSAKHGVSPSSASSSPFEQTFPASATAPPVPSIPSQYSSAPTSSSTRMTRGPSASPADAPEAAARKSSVDMHILPRHPSPVRTRSSTAGGAGMSRDDSHNSLQSEQSGLSSLSAGSSARRRSLSMNSAATFSAAFEPAQTTVSRGRRPSASARSGEDDRLRSELRQWSLGVDGVLGVDGNSPTAGGSPRSTRGGRQQGYRQGSPTSARTASPSRRPSLPEGKALPTPRSAPLAGRSASLPTSSLLPPSSASALPVLGAGAGRGRAAEHEGDTPEIRLVSPSRSTPSPSSSSSAAGNTLPPPVPHPSSQKRHSIASAEGIGLGVALETIAEGAHSRESSLAAATPVKASAGETGSPTPTKMPAVALHAPTPAAASPVPATPANGARSNQRAGVSRASIVGYPSSFSSLPLRSAPPSAAASATSLLSTGAAPSARRVPASAAKKQREREEEERMSEEEVQLKATDAAQRVWDGDEGFLERTRVAEWLGSAGRINVAALRIYIDNFEFAGLRLDVAFRRLCGKLYLKAETQQVDRILEQFSRRYYEDNPKNVYGSADVVHAVSYSLLLLNTDLHVVDTTTRMTRQQFVRNTVEAINAQTGSMDEQLVNSPSPMSPVGTPALLFSSPKVASAEDATAGGEATAVFGSAEVTASRQSVERPRTAASTRSFKDSPASSSLHLPASPNLSRTSTSIGGSGVDSPSRPSASPMRSESLVTVNSVSSASAASSRNLEATLKEMYNAIKSQPIYQTAGSGSGSALHLPSSSSGAGESRPSLSLTPGNSPYATWSSGVNRSASRRSGATSTVSAGSGGSSYKRNSIRGMGAFLGASSSLELARSSSPTPSTSTSLSDEHWSTFSPSSAHHAVPTIGFANSLSHTIIREQREDDDAASTTSSMLSISSAELALLGAPWAKEGLLSRKHYWETTGKRAKDKNWVQAFVVISAGELKMFKFDTSGGTKGGLGGLGGGDWTSSASSIGSISLIHALCSAMPAPGYSRERPHCFVLTLPSGGSYFFQAGTPDLVAEWVATCNYWSARLSKEPLSGGVSNMEYGWNRAEPAVDGDGDFEDIASIRSGHSRMSHAGSAFHSYGGGSANPNDRILVNEWKPPQVPLTPSNLPEEAQLEALKRHADIVEEELVHHNALRSPMIRLYSSRASNGTKALANWERKSSHLLTESVKWTTYIDALASAIRLRSLQRGKKEVEAMLESADADEEEEDEDELAASLLPFEQPPSSIKADSAGPVTGLRHDSATSRVSVATATTGGDEFFESRSVAETPPPS
ncbi:hypothetical protein JCM10213_001130 [Rhodosporidiobolus nylandii]